MGKPIAKTLAAKYRVYVCDRNPDKARIAGVIFDAGFKNLDKADYVIVAVKPQDIPALANDIGKKINSSAILVSIAAGVKINKLQKLFGIKKVVRVMPNLGLLVGQGIAAWRSMGLTKREKQKVKKLLNQLTSNFEVKKESDIDAVTAISGSGPAYFFYLAQALQKTAINLGLSLNMARKLVEKTFLAAAILQRGKNYQELIKQVTSKKGTTEAALKVLNKNHMDQIIEQAVKVAQKRAKELSHA
jgi:pyrroline-5-carboxylate reductase